MGKVLASVIAASVIMASPVAAGVLDYFDRVDGTWSTEAGCDWLDKSKNGWPSVIPKGFDQFSYLKSNSIEGYEWGCKFVHQDSDGHGGIVAVASCSAEGDSWPDLLLLQRDYKSGWRVITKGGRDGTNVELYPVRCDAPPR